MGSICRVPSTPFSQAPEYIQLIHLCRFRVRSIREALSWKSPSLLDQSIKTKQLTASVTLSPGHGILTVFPSTTTFVLAFRADSPYVDEHCVGTLGLSATVSFTRFIVTYVSILTSHTSSPLTACLQGHRQNAPLPLLSYNIEPRRFGYGFSPLHFRRRFNS